MTKDLTNGSPLKSLISFCLPILFGNILQQLYNMTDSAIVGRFIGVDALGGVGATGSINFMVMGLVMGICTGFSINISQAFGANDFLKVKKLFINSIILASISAIILTVITLLFIDDLLVLMNTPENIINYSKTYISTIFAGIFGIFLYNLLASTLRALGDSRTPLLFLIASAILNIALDLIFVLVFEMGVFGTSLATVISQTLSGTACIFLIFKKHDILMFSKSDFKLDKKISMNLLSSGIPMGLQFSITAIGGVVLQYSINGLGYIVVASITASSRIWVVFSQGLEALGVSMANFTGQNIGAGKPDRIDKALKQSIFIGIIYSASCFVLLFFAGDTLALIFLEEKDPQIVQTIHFFLKVVSANMPLLCILLLLRNTIQGLGYSKIAMFAGVFEMVARILLIFAVQWFGVVGASLSNPFAWVCAVAFLVPAFFYVRKKVYKLHKKINIKQT